MCGFFTSITLAIYFLVQAKTKIRMTLIQKGIELPEPYDYRKVLIYIPFVFIGLGTGLLAGYSGHVFLELPELVSYWSMVLLFTGISILICQIVSRQKPDG